MKLPPLIQQRTALERSAGREYFAFFMEQGTGKTYVQLAEAEALYERRAVALLIVIAPNGVHLNWLRIEAPKHLSVPFTAYAWNNSASQKAERERLEFLKSPMFTTLKIAAFNVEAFSLPRSRAEKFLNALLKSHAEKNLLAIDESSTIKNVNSARTKNIWKLRGGARYRRILTGTPLTTSPLNFYAQAKFLYDALLGFRDYVPFKAYYAQWQEKTITLPVRAPDGKLRTRTFPELVRYRNLGELKKKVDAFSYVVTKAQCMDLPPKVHEVRTVVMGPQQRALYDAARRQFITELESPAGERMTIAHAITRLMRLAQITGGFVQPDDAAGPVPIPGDNAKLNSLLCAIEELPPERKVIIWARFTAELRLIHETLGKKNCATYWGETDKEERPENIDRFMNDPECRYFVGNAHCGKFGFTLTAASHMIYFSKDFSPEARWQTEDRAHRIGQLESLTITDLLCADSVDFLIHNVILGHSNLAEFFKGSTRGALIRHLKESI